MHFMNRQKKSIVIFIHFISQYKIKYICTELKRSNKKQFDLFKKKEI